LPEESYEGRLELTWTNKPLCLLADENGDYEWVPPADYRVAEVRLLDTAATVGETRPERGRAKDNLLVRGDALNALRSLSELPEFAKELVGKVKLAYLDPPFNLGLSWMAYEDNIEHSVWLTMMRDRLTTIQKLLAPDGSVWVHCDDTEQAYLKVVMDEVFGRNAWVATIVWQTRTSRENRAAVGTAHNYLLLYSPAGATGWRETRNRLPRSGGSLTNPDNDPRGPWESVPFSAQGYRKNQMYDITTPTGVVHQPPKGRCWGATEAEFIRLRDVEKRIYFTRGGNGRPRVKQFPEAAQGLVPMTWWPASEVGDNEEAKKEILALFPDIEAFDTPKPERLMERVINIATNPGEIVLDCFLGSGTTAAVAHKMGRRWVGVERSADNLNRYDMPRLTRVVEGTDPGGITESIGWEGGGGFRVLDVAPSMFADDRGVIVLADWAINGKLAEVTAAQLGFDFLPEAPFVGLKGRTRLAVIDGLVSEDVARLLAGTLAEDERVVICGTAIDPLAGRLLRELRPGSSVRKIPASILEEYRQTRWTPTVAITPDARAEQDGSTNGAAPQPSEVA
jgi:adenine-specific DNA-methyltransferase